MLLEKLFITDRGFSFRGLNIHMPKMGKTAFRLCTLTVVKTIFLHDVNTCFMMNILQVFYMKIVGLGLFYKSSLYSIWQSNTLCTFQK